MNPFRLAREPIDGAALRAEILDPACGGFAAFEGWVRDQNKGRQVAGLEYEAFDGLALKEGARVLEEAVQRFGAKRALCVHRVGALQVGDVAVWVGVSAGHRDAAFQACRYIIDEVKKRVPVWKKERYQDGEAVWINCEGTGVL